MLITSAKKATHHKKNISAQLLMYPMIASEIRGAKSVPISSSYKHTQKARAEQNR